MGFFRFRQSFRIAPGLRMNIGKRGGSFSAGPRGAKITMGTSGSRASIGIPGTGLSYTEVQNGGDTPSDQESSGCAGCLAQIVVLLLVIVGVAMCSRGKEQTIPSAKPTPAPTATPRATATPTPSPTATPPPFPESHFWPKKVRLLKPVEFTGSVSGGTVRSTVSTGTILPAKLSEDHKSVEVRMNDLSASIPLTDTDFLKRAAARQKRSTE